MFFFLDFFFPGKGPSLGPLGPRSMARLLGPSGPSSWPLLFSAPASPDSGLFLIYVASKGSQEAQTCTPSNVPEIPRGPWPDPLYFSHFGIDKSQNMRPKRIKLYIIHVIRRLYIVKILHKKFEIKSPTGLFFRFLFSHSAKIESKIWRVVSNSG